MTPDSFRIIPYSYILFLPSLEIPYLCTVESRNTIPI